MRIITLKNGMELVIRNANIEDAKGLVEYLEKIAAESDFLTFGEGELDVSVEDEASFINSYIDVDNKLFLVGEINGKIIANLNFDSVDRPRIKHVGEFGVTVLKDYWGLGVGREMISYLIQWAKRNRIIKKINLRVREDHKGGIKLYESLGFYKEGLRTREFCIDGKYYGALYMGLEID